MVQLINITEEKLVLNIKEVVQKEIENLKESIKPQPPHQWVSRINTAKMLDVSFTTLTNWHKKGVLDAYSIGNRVYYKLDEINNALTKNSS